MKREDDKVIRRAINLFLILFLVIGSLLGGTAAILYRTVMNSFLTDLRAREYHSIELQVSAIKSEFDAVVSDILFLAGQNELVHFLDTGERTRLAEIQTEYMRLAATKKVYDQIRYLDEIGHETVRVNYASGTPVSVIGKDLQDKGKRYYFTDCFHLEGQGIFVSPLDLNIEKGIVEQPLKPMIRIGTPVYDSAGGKRGIVLLNYKAARMLDRIFASGGASFGDKMLLNRNGYWLLGPDMGREWGFMFPEGRDDTFALDYSEEWNRILEDGSGQFLTDNGLFSFVTIYPLQEGYRSSTGSAMPEGASSGHIDASSYFWVLLTRVPPDVIKSYTNNLMLKLFLGGGGLFLLIAFGAWHLAMAITRRQIYQAQLVTWAMYDPLTGLPNRKLFFDNLTAGFSLAKRHERKLGLLYIDLDGFKAVNDTYGHEAGDELLIEVGRRLVRIVRKSDTVARLGGDEFAIILTEIKRVDSPLKVGNKIIEALCRPFILKAGTVTVGASIGVAVYPDSEESEKALMKSADRAMYESKAKGKNTCTSADIRSA